MKTVGFTEFRKHASALLDLVEQGETVAVVRHGKVIATVIPARPEATTPSWKRPGLRLSAPGASLAKAVRDERRASR